MYDVTVHTTLTFGIIFQLNIIADAGKIYLDMDSTDTIWNHHIATDAFKLLNSIGWELGNVSVV